MSFRFIFYPFHSRENWEAKRFLPAMERSLFNLISLFPLFRIIITLYRVITRNSIRFVIYLIYANTLYLIGLRNRSSEILPEAENSISRIRAIKINRIKRKLEEERKFRRISRELTREISFLGNDGKKKGEEGIGRDSTDQVETGQQWV